MTQLASFAAKWCHPDYPPEPVSEADLAACDAALGLRFPDDYRAALTQVGALSPTLALLHQIAEQELDLFDLSELAHPSEIAADTSANWEGGAPREMVFIGADCMGNLFGFLVDDLRAGPQKSAPVWFWDHEFDQAYEYVAGFEDWIASYLGEWSDGLGYADFE